MKRSLPFLWLRHLIALCAVLALMLCLGVSSAFAADTVSGTDMRLTATEGTVTLQNADGKALSAREGMRLYSGYTVTTGSRSYAYITLDSTKVVKLDANTTVQLSKDGSNLDLTVISGKLFFNVKAPLSANESLNIRTSTMVTGIRGTSGVVEVQNSTTSAVSIYDGKVEVVTNDAAAPDGVQTTIVEAGQRGISFPVGNEQWQVSLLKLTAEDIPGFAAV